MRPEDLNKQFLNWQLIATFTMIARSLQQFSSSKCVIGHLQGVLRITRDPDEDRLHPLHDLACKAC